MPDCQSTDHPRGVTLIELMVVVAIIGILAAIGGVAYMNQMRKGKITKLKQLALEVKKAQQQYASRNAQYFHDSNDYNPNASSPYDWHTILDFNHPEVASQNIEVKTIAAWPNCSSCASKCKWCPSGVDPSGNDSWYAVRVRQHLKPGGEMTTVITSSTRDDLVVLHSGE